MRKKMVKKSGSLVGLEKPWRKAKGKE